MRWMWIKKLIKLNNLLDNQDIADILLVYGEFKPVTLFEVTCIPHSSTSRSEFRRMVRKLEKYLKELGLRYQLNFNYPKTNKSLTKFSFLAKSEKVLKKIIRANNKKNLQKRRRSVGVLLGYPKSAVESFSKTESIKLDDLPASIKKLPVTRFLNFRISQKWRSELKYVHKRAERIKELSPELYRRIIRHVRRQA
mgnify:CR=1 FL=1